MADRSVAGLTSASWKDGLVGQKRFYSISLEKPTSFVALLSSLDGNLVLPSYAKASAERWVRFAAVISVIQGVEGGIGFREVTRCNEAATLAAKLHTHTPTYPHISRPLILAPVQQRVGGGWCISSPISNSRAVKVNQFTQSHLDSDKSERVV